MANTLVLTGRLANLLARGIVTSSPVAESTRPLAALYDGDPGLPFRFGSLAADSFVQVDVDLAKGEGDFESWSGGTPVGWTESNTGTGSPDVTQDTTLFQSGASSAKFSISPGTGTASITKDFSVRTGEALTLKVYLRNSGAVPGTIKVRCQNLRTGRWLDSAGAWQAAVSDVFSQSGVFSFTLNSRAFTVQSWAAHGGLDRTTLRITIQLTGDGVSTNTSWADLLTLVPTANFLVEVGHNIDAVVAPVLKGGDSTPPATTIVTPNAAQPSFYASFADQTFRYYRLELGGTNSAEAGAIWLGEIILGRVLTLSRAPNFPLQLTSRESQVRNRNAAGGVFVYPQGKELRTITLPFSYRSSAQYQEARDEIIRRGRYGYYPTVIVPLDTESDVLLARKDESDWVVSRSLALDNGGGRWEAPITLEEMAIADVAS